jgi:class 3 adenylate cyclase/tetratricopeptide (TPR) repeat protein
MPALSRKTVTVLFTDVVDSTPLAEALDPEQVRGLMTRYFAEMRGVIERYGGTVEKYIGDAVMAVFGVPAVHEDDALRAVRAAAEMREALARLNGELAHTLEARTGLATGEVVTGHGDTLVTGDTVNLAARLQQTAAAGEILIADATQRLVKDAVAVERLERLELKGKSEPVDAWRLVEVRADAPGRARRFDGELVGRDDELALLKQAYVRVTAGRSCHLFTILGPAGVGKSRLVREFAGAVAGARVLVGRCVPYGDGITYWPLREVVHPLDDLRRYVSDDDALVIGAAVGTADSAAGPDETTRAFRRLLEAVAHERPLVLVLEDIHWGAPAMLDLIDHVASTSRGAPVLVVCLARPELLDERPSWGGGKANATTILLEPLDADQADRLISNLAGDALDPANRQTITEAAEGNPLFLEEMVAMVVDEGAAATIPPSINALLAARLELLPDVERSTLAVAAVVGRFFSADAVVALAGEDARPVLDALERKDLIRAQRVPFTQGDAFRFRHILIRDAAYDGLSKAERADLHVRLATWLEASGPQHDVEELAAWHLEAAFSLKRDLGEHDGEIALRAHRALARVGRRALGLGDVASASSLLERALAIPAGDARPRLELQLDLVVAVLESGRLARAEEFVADAIDRARDRGDDALLARALVERSHLLFHTDPELWVQTARTTAEETRGPLETAGDDIGLARSWMLVVINDYIRWRGDELETALERALHHARRTRDRRHVQALLTIAVRSVLCSSLHVDDAIDACDRLVADGADAAVMHGVRGFLNAMAGRFEEARTDCRAGQALHEELGRTRQLAVHRFYSGSVELLAGDGAAAEREARRALKTLEEIGDRGTFATLAAVLAAALHLQGRDDDARRWAERAGRDASAADVITQVQWRTTLARLLPDRGVDLAEQALAVASRTTATVLQADAALCLRDVLVAAGRDDEAVPSGELAASLYGAKGHVVGVRWAGSPSSAAVSGSRARTVAGGT